MGEEDIDLSEGADELVQPKKVEPITVKDRMIATLLFDTQPKRRAAYFKRLGYEMNPKDDNEIRPIGGGEYFKIDPGGVFNFKQYGEKGAKEGLSEFGRDALEGFLDTLQGSVTEGAGIGGAIIGAPAGPVGMAAGRTGGRIAMFNAIENMKDKIGDMFLDEEVPVDYAIRATQSAIQGVAPEVIAAGGSALKKAGESSLKAVSGAVKNMLKLGDGKIGNQAWDAITKNPGLLSDERTLSSASPEIDATVARLIGGENKKTADFTKTVFQEQMNPIEAMRKSEAAKLDSKIQLDPSLFRKWLDGVKVEMESPVIKSQTRKDSIGYLSEKIDEIDKYVASQVKNMPAQSGQKVLIPFSKVDEMVKELQNDLYTPKLLTKDWRPAIKQIVDGPTGLNSMLKKAATDAGSPYAQLKQKEMQMFDAFEGLVENVDTKKARQFVLGDDLVDTLGGNVDTTARNFRLAIEKADGVLGTKIGEGLKTGQIQNQIWTEINRKGSAGSRSAIGLALTGGATAGGAAKALGASNEAAVLAGLTGAATSTLAGNPKIGVPIVGAAERAAQSIATAGPSQISGNVASALGTRAAIQAVEGEQIPQQSTQPVAIDELEDIDLSQ